MGPLGHLSNVHLLTSGDSGEKRADTGNDAGGPSSSRGGSGRMAVAGQRLNSRSWGGAALQAPGSRFPWAKGPGRQQADSW